MKDIIIEKMKENDIETVAKIFVNSWKIAYKGIIDEKYLQSLNIAERVEEIKENYLDKNHDKNYIVAKVKETKEIVGVARYGERLDELDKFKKYDGEIHALYVKPGLLRKKIGSKLLKYAIKKLNEQGKRKMLLWCLKDNEPSRKFYERMGGILLGEKAYIIGGKEYPVVGYGYEI